nr:hypothetical protein [uncultured Flavobacterium sp.]
MKRGIIYIIVLATFFQSFSNLWIIGAFYVNQDYIAQNLCINRFDKIPLCNGKCYLNTKLSKNESKEEKIPNIKEKETLLYFAFQKTIAFTITITLEIRQKIVDLNVSKIRAPYLFAVLQPPKLA